ncbi:MAG: hypothetical protein HXY34_13370 [Candidatus Thorarchaeota archaeon]|nr:hypothetical protein [Candidatus Thorarchaeota archaeon]
MTSYEGVIPVPSLGMYSIIFRNPTNESVSFRVDMTKRVPQVHIFVPSACLTVLGVGLSVIVRLSKRSRAAEFVDHAGVPIPTKYASQPRNTGYLAWSENPDTLKLLPGRRYG